MWASKLCITRSGTSMLSILQDFEEDGLSISCWNLKPTWGRQSCCFNPSKNKILTNLVQSMHRKKKRGRTLSITFRKSQQQKRMVSLEGMPQIQRSALRGQAITLMTDQQSTYLLTQISLQSLAIYGQSVSWGRAFWNVRHHGDVWHLPRFLAHTWWCVYRCPSKWFGLIYASPPTQTSNISSVEWIMICPGFWRHCSHHCALHFESKNRPTQKISQCW